MSSVSVYAKMDERETGRLKGKYKFQIKELKTTNLTLLKDYNIPAMGEKP